MTVVYIDHICAYAYFYALKDRKNGLTVARSRYADFYRADTWRLITNGDGISEMKPRISMISLGVDNLPRSIEFYENGLGLPRIDSPPEVAFFPLNGSWLGLYSRESMASEAGVKITAAISGYTGHAVTLAHNVSSDAEVDATVALARLAGAIVTRAPAKTEWGGYSGYFSDPDGHLWEVAHNPFLWVGPEDQQ